jgi:fibronectin type 3 domain-containing protein
VPDEITEFSQSLLEYENGKAKLIWTEPNDNGSPILHYIVTRDVGSGVFFQVYNGTENSFVDEGLETGNSYNYKVKSFNVIGFSSESVTVTAIAG